MGPRRFKATPDEIEFAEWIWRKTLPKSTGTFNRDAAIRIFIESGFSFTQIREMWTIADRNGDGQLSKEELCVLVRMAGRVQQLESGATVSESLLEEAGPLPVLKISCVSSNPKDHAHVYKPPDTLNQRHGFRTLPDEVSAPRPTIIQQYDESYEWYQPGPQLVYPLITAAHKEACRCLFESADTSNGLMDRGTAEEVLVEHFGGPLFGLRTILDLVRTTHLFSLDILEFTLAAYFLVGLKTGTMNTLPTEVPEELYDQLWTPTTLGYPHINPVNEIYQRRTDNIASAAESPAPSAQNNVNLTTVFRPSPVRKNFDLKTQSRFSERCPSMSSFETKKTNRIWNRVAEKVLKLSSMRNRNYQRASISPSDISVNGTIHTEFSESSVAERSDTFFHPTRGCKVSKGTTRLPLVYLSKTGYYESPNSVSPMGSPHPIGADNLKYVPDNIGSRSSITVQQVEKGSEGTITARSSFSFDELAEDIVEVSKEKVMAQKESKIGIQQVFDMLTEMKEEYTTLSEQMQMIQESIQKLELTRPSTPRSVHFACSETDAGAGSQSSNIILRSETLRRTRSPKLSKDPAGPREMLSSRPMMLPSGTGIRPYGDYRHYRREKPERVQGPRRRRRGSESSLTSFSSNSASLSENSSTIPRPALRPILKVQVNNPSTRDEAKNNTRNGLVSGKQNAPVTAAATKHGSHKRAAKGFGISEEMLQRWDARFIPVDKILTGDKRIFTTTEDGKLPWPIRKPPTVGAVGVKLGGALTASLSSKSHSALADNGRGTSLVRISSLTASSICSHSPDEDMNTRPTPFVLHEFVASTLRSAPSLDTPPDSRRASVGTTLSDADIDTAHTSCSAAGFSSLFSHRRQSACTTLLTEIDEHNDTVLKDLQETAPQFMQQVKKIVLRDLRTKVGHSVANMGDEAVDNASTTNTVAAPPRFSPPRYSQILDDSEHGPVPTVRDRKERPETLRRPWHNTLPASESANFVYPRRRRETTGSDRPSEVDLTPYADSESLHKASTTKLKFAKKIIYSIPKISGAVSGYLVKIAKSQRNAPEHPHYASSVYNPGLHWPPLGKITDDLLG